MAVYLNIILEFSSFRGLKTGVHLLVFTLLPHPLNVAPLLPPSTVESGSQIRLEEQINASLWNEQMISDQWEGVAQEPISWCSPLKPGFNLRRENGLLLKTKRGISPEETHQANWTDSESSGIFLSHENPTWDKCWNGETLLKLQKCLEPAPLHPPKMLL